MSKVAFTGWVPKGLRDLFVSEMKARRIRISTGVEQALVAALEKLGVPVPPELLEEEDRVAGPMKGPLTRA